MVPVVALDTFFFPQCLSFLVYTGSISVSENEEGE